MHGLIFFSPTQATEAPLRLFRSNVSLVDPHGTLSKRLRFNFKYPLAKKKRILYRFFFFLIFMTVIYLDRWNLNPFCCWTRVFISREACFFDGRNALSIKLARLMNPQTSTWSDAQGFWRVNCTMKRDCSQLCTEQECKHDRWWRRRAPKLYNCTQVKRWHECINNPTIMP